MTGVANAGTAPTQTRRLAAVAAIDEVIFGEHAWLDMDSAAVTRLRHQLVSEAFDWHLGNCPPYRRFAERAGVAAAADLDGDLSRIPHLPVSLFKRHPVRSVDAAEIVHSFTSSGTSGVRSVVHRDDVTLQRFCGSLRPDGPVLSDIVGGLDDETGVILNLGPTRFEAGQVWFAYVMGLLEQLAPMRYYVSGNEFRLAEAAAELRRAVTDHEHVLLVGAPFLVADLMEYVTGHGIDIAGGTILTVFTGGGWKRELARSVSPERFRANACTAFGLADETQVRDVFNQVEVNSVFPECRHHHKHIPPWVHAVTRDPVTFAPQPPGTPGVLCYSDASARSYPCFVISDDIGVVEEGDCDCGRAGSRLVWQRRLRGATHQGCAETLATMRPAREQGSER
ncbi:hypothetical protein ACFYTQ_01380 [Nocardia sp. NPDC004068]|uniref:LuxE/PaaK family acyltransferase n=1 Tax=Nocardia sp. NPDC004068 TaxID=3364303 RepID=UPI0036AC5029